MFLTPAEAFHNSEMVSMNYTKKRKERTVFTEKQLLILENKFRVKKYLSNIERDEIAKSLELDDTKVDP